MVTSATNLPAIRSTTVTDEAGVVHTEREPHVGEAWLQGPVILSWADVAPRVDGVNVVSGDTAAPSQSGYVLGAYECADIQGWRKNLSRTAAFYFTELPDAYATRTGRPQNVGVIGVAVFREKQPPITWRPYRDNSQISLQNV